MLNERDIAFMKRTRDEVTHNRQRPLILEIVGEPKRNPITGVEEDGETVELTVQSIVTDRTSRVAAERRIQDRKSTRLNSSHVSISYAVFCLKKKKDRSFTHHPKD